MRKSDLLLLQSVLEEIRVQVFKIAENKDLLEVKIHDATIYPELLNKGYSKEDIGRAIAILVVDSYIRLESSDGKATMYITLLPKGLQAAASSYFKIKYDETVRNDWKFWVQLLSEIIVGVTAIIALLISSGAISCNKQDKSTYQIQSLEISNTQPETKLNPIPLNDKQDSLQK